MKDGKCSNKDSKAKAMRLNGLRKGKKQELRDERRKRLKEKGKL
jgi:hypothetical protein